MIFCKITLLYIGSDLGFMLLSVPETKNESIFESRIPITAKWKKNKTSQVSKRGHFQKHNPEFPSLWNENTIISSLSLTLCVKQPSFLEAKWRGVLIIFQHQAKSIWGTYVPIPFYFMPNGENEIATIYIHDPQMTILTIIFRLPNSLNHRCCWFSRGLLKDFKFVAQDYEKIAQNCK